MHIKQPAIYILASKKNGTMADAMTREKYIKAKSRQFKINMIETTNFEWHDLYQQDFIQ